MTSNVEFPDDPIAVMPRGRLVGQLALYFTLAFALTWGLGALLIFARPQLEALIGPIGQVNHHWLYYVAVYSPTISAILSSLLLGGWTGLKILAQRFTRRVKPVWILFSILIWPFSLAVYALTMRALGRGEALDLHALAIGMPATAFATPMLFLDPGGFGEETGWRGYALPRLLALTGPLTAGALLGVIWGVWHLPAFFVSGLAQSKFGFGMFVLAATFYSLVMTWIYMRANGNVVAAGIIPHLISNLAFDAHVFRGDPLNTEVIVGGLLAFVLFALFGRDLLLRRSKS